MAQNHARRENAVLWDLQSALAALTILHWCSKLELVFISTASGFPPSLKHDKRKVLDMDERVFFHLSEVLPDDVKAPSTSGGGSAAENSGGGVAESAPEVEGATSTANNSGSGKPVIRTGQEVAFRIGQRQGKPLGLRVRKLKPGTLPTEESLPGRFVGVVVVPPRNVGTDKEKEKVSVPPTQTLFLRFLFYRG